MRDDDRILMAYWYLHPNYSPPPPRCFQCGELAEKEKDDKYWCEQCWEFINRKEEK